MENCKFKIVKNCLPVEIQHAVLEIQNMYPQYFSDDNKSREILFIHDVSLNGARTEFSPAQIKIFFQTATDAFRALGGILGGRNENCYEKRVFKSVGFMLDASRNGVPAVNAVKQFLTKAAMLGFNMGMLYTEDTYEVKNEPFWGYLRGAYSHEELCEIDSYAAMFGIEMIPCIQLLGHLEQALQWPAFAKISDTDRVLLAHRTTIEDFLRKLIKAASSPFRSKRIHVGMDEAGGLGSGLYKFLFGARDTFDIITEHLTTVRELCAEAGLRPMIWSDMFLRFGSKDHFYHDASIVVTEKAKQNTPKDVDLVYWDYDSIDSDLPDTMLAKHAELGVTPVVACGAWTWKRFWSASPYAQANIKAISSAAKQHDVKENLITIWADDGVEGNYFSALPAMYFLAHESYEGCEDINACVFRGALDGELTEWTSAAALDEMTLDKMTSPLSGNISKCLLWQDPVFSIVDPLTENLNLNEYYKELNEDLSGHIQDCKYLAVPAQLAKVLSIKSDMRHQISQALKIKDIKSLKQWRDILIPELNMEIRKLWELHRALWLELYKPYGWEVIEQRYGGLLLRLETVQKRLDMFLKKEIDSIPELTETLLDVFNCTQKQPFPLLDYSRLKTPSTIK